MQGIVSILKQFNEALPIKINFNYIMLGLSSPEGETKKSYNGMNEMFLIKMFQLYHLEPFRNDLRAEQIYLQHRRRYSLVLNMVLFFTLQKRFEKKY